MTADGFVSVFSTNNHIILNLGGLAPDGWYSSGAIRVADKLDAGSVGAAVEAAIGESGDVHLSADAPEVQDDSLVRQRLAETAGWRSYAEFVRNVRFVRVTRYGADYDIEHSEAVGGRRPTFRLFSKRQTLTNPSTSELGAEVLAAFDRCTRTGG